ncbi:MAG: hypothetical protein AAFV38_12050, partial [Pseudomonadota bacterium]
MSKGPYEDALASAEAFGLRVDGGGVRMVQPCPGPDEAVQSTSPCHTSQVSIGSRATGQVVTWTHADRTRIVDQWLGKRLGGDDMLLQLCAADRTTLDVQVDHRVEPECAIAAHPAVEWPNGRRKMLRRCPEFRVSYTVL